jgi:CPA2 family monovalent cation:H+ antiporter-2
MDTAVSLQSVLVLLASAVVAVALCRSLRLPPIVGYLAPGSRSDRTPRPALQPRRAAPPRRLRRRVPHVLDRLEFSLSRLISMRRIVFGFGARRWR